MARGREKFSKYKKIIGLLSKIYKLLPYSRRLKKFIKSRNKPGTWGMVKRYALLKTLCKSVGDNVSVKEGVYLLNVQNLSIGNNVSIHPMTYIEAAGGVTIGDDVSIAHSVTIMSATHNYSSKEMAIKDQGVELKPVVIENDVWIGAKSTILCGLTVSSGSIIGANSVVTKNVESDSIVAGAPAKLIKRR